MGRGRRYRITGGRVIVPDGVVAPGELTVRDGLLMAVTPAGKAERSAGEKVIEAEGCWVVPGFIDLHVHGGGGADTMDSSVESLVGLGRFLARHGCTGFLATTMSASGQELAAAISAVEQVRKRGTGGARVLGVHLEGPYLNPEHAGAHLPEYLRRPDVAEIDALMGVAPEAVKMVTLAPELPGCLEVISYLHQRGVVAAGGHSAATFDQARRAFQAGLRHVTHLFNAMRRFHHREPGLAGFALTEPNLSFELIADEMHLHPAAAVMALRLGGVYGSILVTDAMRASGLGDGEYQLGRQKVIVRDGVARLPGGQLAGSLLTPDAALRNFGRWLGWGLPDIVHLLSLNPARVLAQDSEMGSLEIGKSADVVVLDTRQEVCLTMVQGEIVYRRVDFGVEEGE